MSPGRLTAAMARGVAYLAVQQRSDGGFMGYVSTSVEPFETKPAAVTTFQAALILGAIAKLRPAPGLAELQQRLAAFLMQQRSTAWTFNYWPRTSLEAVQRPYPDDLDDTFCALLALQRYQSELVSPEVMAAVVRQLTHCEREVGGPYVTWIVPPEALWPRDVDLGVNCNVGTFLMRQGVVLPRLVGLVEQAIADSAYTTPYYAVSPYAIMYFMARFYRGDGLRQLRTDLWERRDTWGGWGNALDTALAVSAALEMGISAKELAPAIEQLLAMEVEGAWPAAALYVERRDGDTVHYAGAATLTTALVLESLEAYSAQTAEPLVVEQGMSPSSSEAETVMRAVMAEVQQRLKVVPGELAQLVPELLDRLLVRDERHEIILLAHHFERSLRPSLSRAMSSEVVSLGVANVYGWLAYTAYDDLLDGDGRPEWLSVANVTLRQAMWQFERLAQVSPEIPVLAHSLLDQVDAANAWEVMRTRVRVDQGRLQVEALPDYGDLTYLADRSYGHALGPLCLLLIRGLSLDSDAVAQTRLFFRHYLIARQLNDDVHDWEVDLRRGQLNVVGVRLLRTLGQMPPGGWVLSEILPVLQRQLWQHDIEPLCAEVLWRVEQAQVALRLNPELRETAWLDGLVEPLAAAARRALEERSRTQTFLATYLDVRSNS